jgi:hypothetical protein
MTNHQSSNNVGEGVNRAALSDVDDSVCIVFSVSRRCRQYSLRLLKGDNEKTAASTSSAASSDDQSSVKLSKTESLAACEERKFLDKGG